MKNRLTLSISAVLVGLTLTLAACSSDSSSSNATTTVSTGPQETAVGCPFTGTVAGSSGGSASVAAATLTGITTAKQGCVDNIQMDLGTGVPTWKAAYATGPILDAAGATISTTAPANLVFTITGATWKGAGSTPATVLPVQLDYVTSIRVVSGPNNTLLVIYGLDKQRPYQASDSSQPAYISLGIG